MLKETSDKDSNSTNSQNQGLNRTKILPCSSKDASRDSVELKFEQLVDQLGELISSENTLVINLNEEIYFSLTLDRAGVDKYLYSDFFDNVMCGPVYRAIRSDISIVDHVGPLDHVGPRWRDGEFLRHC